MEESRERVTLSVLFPLLLYYFFNTTTYLNYCAQVLNSIYSDKDLRRLQHGEPSLWCAMRCDDIGSRVDVKPLIIVPRVVIVTPFHVASDYRTFTCGKYRTQMVKFTSAEQSALLRELMFDVDSRSATPAQVLEAFTASTEHPNDPVAAITASENTSSSRRVGHVSAVRLLTNY